jgi:hypothetical protein
MLSAHGLTLQTEIALRLMPSIPEIVLEATGTRKERVRKAHLDTTASVAQQRRDGCHSYIAAREKITTPFANKNRATRCAAQEIV